jgi:spore germination protein YaaH
MAINRLPVPNGDNGNWGAILNGYLRTSLNAEGGMNVWTTATRPTAPDKFATGVNTTLDIMERWDGSAWVQILNNPAASSTTTNTIANPINTITSTVNGIAATTSAVNTNTIALSGTNLTSTVNGVASAALNLSPLVAASTTNTLASATNTLTNTTNGVVATANIVNTNTSSITGSSIVTTVNGVASAALNIAPAVTAASTNTIANPINTITSTVNGIAATTSAVNTNTIALSGTNLTSTVNGVASAALNLSPILITNTNVTAANNFATQAPAAGYVYSNNTNAIVTTTAPVQAFYPKTSYIWDAVNSKFIQVKEEMPANSWKSTTSGYIFPANVGSDQEKALTVDIQKYKPHIIRPQWFNIDLPGTTLVINNNGTGVNGYSPANEAIINANSQLGCMPMVKGEDIGTGNIVWPLLMATAAKRTSTVNFILAQMAAHPTWIGIEIDFEPTASWASITQTDIDNKMLFLKELSTAMHQPSVNKLVSVAIGATFNQDNLSQLADNLTLVDTGVDYIMIMNYDWDYPAISSVAPITRWTEAARWAVATIPLDKLVMGIPSYGSVVPAAAWNTNNAGRHNKPGAILTPGYANRVRNSHTRVFGANTWLGGNDLYWENAGTVYNIPDTQTLDSLRQIGENLGIKHFAVWSMSGNDWFSGQYAGSLRNKVEPNYYTITASSKQA